MCADLKMPHPSEECDIHPGAETEHQKGISMGRGYKMQSCSLVISRFNAEDQPAFIYRVKSLFVRLLMQRQSSTFVCH